MRKQINKCWMGRSPLDDLFNDQKYFTLKKKCYLHTPVRRQMNAQLLVDERQILWSVIDLNPISNSIDLEYKKMLNHKEQIN